LYPSNLIQSYPASLGTKAYITKKKFDEDLRSTALSIISPAQSMDYSRRFHRDAVFLEEEAK